MALFNKVQALALPPYQGWFNHHICLIIKKDSSALVLPWGPFYNIP